MLITIVALCYVVDAHYPMPNKHLLEILDHTIFADDVVKSNKANLAIGVQQVLLELEPCERHRNIKMEK
jgi:hypothetical protein